MTINMPYHVKYYARASIALVAIQLYAMMPSAIVAGWMSILVTIAISILMFIIYLVE